MAAAQSEKLEALLDGQAEAAANFDVLKSKLKTTFAGELQTLFNSLVQVIKEAKK